MKENPNLNDVLNSVIDGGLTVEEALNAFIDDELTPRQNTEIHRLIAHDQRIAQRLLELQSCRILVSSLPYVETPSDMLDNIKASLEKRSLLDNISSHWGQRKGQKHLLARRLVSAAAMVVLVAVLGVVVYNIVGPGQVPQKAVVSEGLRRPAHRPEVTPPQALTAANKKTTYSPAAADMSTVAETKAEFNLRLELRTANPAAVNAFISRAVEDKGISECEVAKSNAGGTIHIVSCNRDTLKSLAADLESIWEKFDSAALSVQTDHLDKVAIGSINARQIAEVVNQDTFQKSFAVAKNFAALNNITGSMPGREVLTAVANDKKPDLTAVPKPVLTSSEKIVKKSTAQPQTGQQVNLTIVVTADK